MKIKHFSRECIFVTLFFLRLQKDMNVIFIFKSKYIFFTKYNCSNYSAYKTIKLKISFWLPLGKNKVTEIYVSRNRSILLILSEIFLHIIKNK